MIHSVCPKIIPLVLWVKKILIPQGVVFPAINSMIATWVPPLERSRYNTIIYSGRLIVVVDVVVPRGEWYPV